MNQSISQPKRLTKLGLKATSYLEKCGGFFPAIIFRLDLVSEKAICINDKLSDLGYTNQELASFPEGFAGLAFPDDVHMVESEIAGFGALPEGGTSTFVARFRHKDGGCSYLKNFCSRVDASTVIIMSQNITEQVRFEQEATAARQLFDETEKLLLFGSWSWSLKTDKLEWTEGMFELLEYDDSTEAGSINNQFLFKHIDTEHVDHVQTVWTEAVSLKKAFETEFLIRTRTGKEKYVFMKGKPLLDNEGNVKKVVGITRDITSKKNFENELDRNIRELNRSNKELEEFAYVASHDLHEPLRKVLTFSERLKTRFGSALGDDGKVYLERIWASADSMRNLIDNLLEFSKMTKGSRSFTHCDLNDVLKEVLADQELRIEETSTNIKACELASVVAVPSELKQLFNNLIGNALKFRKKDVTPVLEISCSKLSHKEKSDLLLPFNQVFYQIDISDNGIGFDSVYAEKIFEIFQRLHGKAEYAGSGIGLAICKKIVDNHDGIIYATSEPGKGSTFSVILPEKQH